MSKNLSEDEKAARNEKINRGLGIFGTIASGVGNIFTNIFGGSTSSIPTSLGGSGGFDGVPVSVGVDSSTKKYLMYAGIAGGVLLLVIVLILAFKKK